MKARFAIACCVLAAAPARAERSVFDDEAPASEPAPAEPPEPEPDRDRETRANATAIVPPVRAGAFEARLSGSLKPMFGLVHSDATVARDRWAYGVAGSSIDFGIDARVGSGVSGTLYLGVGTDRDATGKLAGKVSLERAVVSYQPISALRLAVGRESVPLTAQSATPTVARVFPARIALDDTFVLPADVGLQAQLSTDRISAYGGLWNGISTDAMLEPGASERGLLYSMRVEVTPLGAFAFDEGRRQTELRIGIGAAATYRAATAFTPTGTAGVRSRDLRATASLRMSWRGLFVQAEALRRQITDDLSMRPDVATAGYVQASWRFRSGQVDIAPLARAGIEYIRQLSAPATGRSLELGAAVFPFAAKTDRLQLSALFAHVVEPDLGTMDVLLAQLRLGF